MRKPKISYNAGNGNNCVRIKCGYPLENNVPNGCFRNSISNTKSPTTLGWFGVPSIYFIIGIFIPEICRSHPAAQLGSSLSGKETQSTHLLP
jgi:hypothetical protein